MAFSFPAPSLLRIDNTWLFTVIRAVMHWWCSSSMWRRKKQTFNEVAQLFPCFKNALDLWTSRWWVAMRSPILSSRLEQSASNALSSPVDFYCLSSQDIIIGMTLIWTTVSHTFGVRDSWEGGMLNRAILCDILITLYVRYFVSQIQ